MVELPLFVRLIPKNLDKFKGEIESKVTIGGKRGISKGISGAEVGAMTEVAEEVGENKKISLGMLGKLGAIVGGTALILKAIMDLKPVQVMLSMITKIISLFFLPFAMMGLKLLRPALVFLLRLMVLWYKFWQDPIGKLGEAFSGLFEGVSNLGEYLKGILTPENIIRWMFPVIGVSEILLRLFTGKNIDLGSLIWNKLLEFWKTTYDFGSWIWEKLKGVWNWTYDFGGWLWEQLILIWEWHYNFAKWLWEKITSIWKWAYDFGGWLWNQITKSIKSGLDILSNLGKAIYNWIKDKIESIGSFIGNVGTGIRKAIGLDDFIISGGRVYKTNPNDMIVGTKNPTGQNINNIHIHVTGFMDDDLIPVLVDKITDELDRRVRW